MSDIIISGPATLWFAPTGTDIPSDDESFEDAGWQSVDTWFDGSEREVNFEPITVTAKFTPSPELWGILVGLQLQYNLRELHRSLARYAYWPYTN